jgi:hypothetical protein
MQRKFGEEIHADLIIVNGNYRICPAIGSLFERKFSTETIFAASSWSVFGQNVSRMIINHR